MAWLQTLLDSSHSNHHNDCLEWFLSIITRWYKRKRTSSRLATFKISKKNPIKLHLTKTRISILKLHLFALFRAFDSNVLKILIYNAQKLSLNDYLFSELKLKCWLHFKLFTLFDVFTSYMFCFVSWLEGPNLVISTKRCRENNLKATQYGWRLMNIKTFTVFKRYCDLVSNCKAVFWKCTQ